MSLPVTYGEGDKALGRLLSQLLMSSGDTSILAWSEKSGSFNSCLLANVAVFSQPPTSYIPPAIANAEMGTTTAGLRAFSPNVTLVTKLYDQLNALPIPFFVGQRIKLPCLTFKMEHLSTIQNVSELERVFRVQAAALGVVEIKTKQDLSQLDSLYLVHPWIDFLLDRQLGNVTETTIQERDDQSSGLGELPSFPRPSNITSTTRKTRTARLIDHLGRTFGGRLITSSRDAASLSAPPTVFPMDKQMRIYQFLARLRRPFGALLLTPARRNVEEYRRVAAESLITVQVEEITPAMLDELIQGVRVLDVL